MQIPFSKLPGSSNLLLDILAREEWITARFPESFPPSVLPEAWRRYDRSTLTDAIQKTMKETLHMRQQENLDALLQPETSVVITGQQAGLFGGPLYTLLKAWSAVHIAHQQSASSGHHVVPIFWVEDNDHDIEEIASTTILDSEYRSVELAFTSHGSEDRIPVSDRRFDETIADVVAQLRATAQTTEYTVDILSVLEQSYAPGMTPSDAFTSLMNWMLKETGMLFVSGAVLQKQGLFAPIVREELLSPGRTYDIVEQVSSALKEQGYHAQALPQRINLFMIDNGRRHRLQMQEDGSYRAGEHIYTIEQLQSLAQSHPERFSPNVLLRPIMQDMLFPTLAYIAGPGEIAYAAQLKEVYKRFDVHMPAFILRHSLTFIERKFWRFMEEYTLELQNFYQPYEAMEKSFMVKIGDATLEQLFADAEQKIKEVFSTLHDPVVAVDATLEGTLGRAETQALQQCEMLHSKAIKAQKRNESAVLLRLRQAHALIYPQHGLQERTVGWIYFCNRFGKEALNRAISRLVRLPADVHYGADIAALSAPVEEEKKFMPFIQ